MDSAQNLNYQRIAKAIEFIKADVKNQPNLDEVAEMVNVSPFHFQRMFTDWVGISPKKFLQFTTLEYAKSLLVQSSSSLFETTDEMGLSSTSRLHDLFIKIEGMTPAEYKNGGKDLQINYHFADSPFGSLLIGSTQKGICYLAFVEENQTAFLNLKQHFPNASFNPTNDFLQEQALHIFTQDWTNLNQIKLHLKGTEFQLKVWQALLQIPLGKLTTYGLLAQKIENPNASRAVGSAIGSNPIAFLIPCHRVIQSTGLVGGYRWGSTRKTAIIGWEGARINS